MCENSPLTPGFVHVCKNKSILLTEKSFPPRSWFEVPKLARLCSDAKIYVKCVVRCTLPSSPLISLQINSLPPESSLYFGSSCTCWRFIFLPCHQPGFSVAAIVSPRAETLRPGLPERCPGGPCPGRRGRGGDSPGSAGYPRFH